MSKLIWQISKVGIKVLGVFVVLGIVFWVVKSLTTPAQIKKEININNSRQADNLEATRIDIYGLIDSGNYELADMAVKQMAVDFAGNYDLPRRLWEAANRYDKRKAFDYSKVLCKQIIANYPNDEYATYAALQLAKLKAYELVDEGDHRSAYTLASQIMKDFTGHVQLPRRLWEIANRYDKREALGYSKILCEQIVANYSNDEYATYAALQLAKLKAYELIDKGEYKSAYSIVSTIMKDFKSHKQLPRRLWEIANRYDKQKAFNYSKILCEQIVANYSNDEYATYAALQLAKLKTYELIDADDYEAADLVVFEIMEDFAGHKQLSRRLYEIAQRYSEEGAETYAKTLHGQIATDYPNDKYGSRSALQTAKLGTFELIDAGNYEAADLAISQMKTDFAGNPLLYDKLDSVVERYVLAGKYEEAIELANFTAVYPTDRNYYMKGFCYCELNNYEEALKWYNKLIIEFPGSDMSNDAVMQTGKILYFQGKYQESVDAFREVLSHNPSEALAKEAKQNIKDIEKLFLKKS